MNYRHAYHAGNFADVMKHALLLACIRYLQQKDAPLCLIDTHAGVGLYDLKAPETQKTGEAAQGILKLLAKGAPPEPLAPYVDLVRTANKGSREVRYYPGSPWLMAVALRAKDRAVACEAHPEDAARLTQDLGKLKRLRIVEGDGYRALASLVPPPERRGLVLIDPPFEAPDEFEMLAANFIAAHRKWSTGLYLLWYPIKDDAAIARFHDELRNAQIGKLLDVSFDIGGEAEGLRRCGLVIANPPWILAREWAIPMAWLAETLGQGPGAGAAFSWLRE